MLKRGSASWSSSQAHLDSSALVCLEACFQGSQGSTLLALFVVVRHVTEVKIYPPGSVAQPFSILLRMQEGCKHMRNSCHKSQDSTSYLVWPCVRTHGITQRFADWRTRQQLYSDCHQNLSSSSIPTLPAYCRRGVRLERGRKARSRRGGRRKDGCQRIVHLSLALLQHDQRHIAQQLAQVTRPVRLSAQGIAAVQDTLSEWDAA